MSMRTMEVSSIPSRAGFWLRQSDGEIFDVYTLDPAGGQLCVWCGDVGASLDATIVWDTDEWLGHIPVSFWFDETEGPFQYLGIERPSDNSGGSK